MTTQLRKLVFYGTVLLGIGVAFALYLYLIASKETPGDEVAYTMEAMMCPDGSGVGRSGPECAFAPCPNQDSFTGELIVQGDQYILSVTSALTGTGDVTYALPLVITDAPTAHALIGTQVTVRGVFTEGNILEVETISAAKNQSSVPGATEATLAVGQSAFIGGVRVTLGGIESDSRCPTDAECIQAGALTVSVTLESDTDSKTVLMMSDQPPLPFDAYEVSIVNVAPEALSTQVLGAANYRVTFKVTKLPEVDSALEAYLRDNIETLSPAKAVLGGTFYITSLRQSSDTSAVVQYEDGHIALTADVIFTKTSTGEIQIEEFIIRRGAGF